MVYVGGQLVPDLQGISATVPKSARTATIKVGVGIGAWETVANQVPGGSGMTGVSHQGSNWVVSFPKAEGGPGGARILVTHTVRDWETRVLAVDKDGKEHTAPSSESSGTDAFTQIIAKFPELPLEQVKEFQFQVRSYEWVEFRDVALQPRDAPAAVGTASFGAVIERTLFEDLRAESALDLDKAETMKGPTVLVSPRQLERWMADSGMDLLGGVVSSGARGLSAFAAVVVPLPRGEWDAPAERVLALLATNTPLPRTDLTRRDGLPSTYVFKTREGGMGVLEIVGFTDSPSGVQIRYKPVRTRS